MKSVYVYYRIDPAQGRLAADRVNALLCKMAAHCITPPRRLSRCDDATTWMEIYEGVTDFAAFCAAMDQALARFDTDAFILGDRHLECFSTAETSS